MILPIQHLHYEVAKGGDRVGANERRLAILHSLCRQGETTASALAHEYSVSTRTIRSDMLTLARVYPIVSRRGQNGCYSLAEWYDPSHNLLTHFSYKAAKIRKAKKPDIRKPWEL